ncbi:precorrin-6Y C5,15-methyltransferase (decarboxylating) subunit CbiT [Methanimicrococcus sp. OttesenSCG-928-J09]|nr:precorrin-6Y C5,15-methyltransferase (decarboxylating) subunit CbiT [Methanimicrococcus sp. OttesenSCG-928-J09]
MPELIGVTGGPTKPEIIAVSLFKLDVRDGDVFADVGCGTGLISIEATRFADNLKIYAMDAREVAVDAATQNFKNFGIENAEVIFGESSEVISNLEKVDCAFVGGTKNIIAVLDALIEKGARSIIVNAVRIETVVRVIEHMKKRGVYDETVHIIASHGEELTGETYFKPENPVYIMSAKQKSKS